MSYLLAPAAIVGVVFNLADDLPGGVRRSARRGCSPTDSPPTSSGSRSSASAAVALVLAAAAAGSLLVDWDFTLRDEGERLAAARGLLTRALVHLDRERIRGADVRDSPLRRPPRAGRRSRRSPPGCAGATAGRRSRPWCAAEEVPALRALSTRPRRTRRAAGRPSARRGRSRRLIRALACRSSPWSPPCLRLWMVGWAVALAAAALGGCRSRSTATASSATPSTAGGWRCVEGTLRRRWSELDPDAVVSFELRSSPGQRRAGLATLTVHLGQGAGSRRALDLGEEQAADAPRARPARAVRPVLPAVQEASTK